MLKAVNMMGCSAYGLFLLVTIMKGSCQQYYHEGRVGLCAVHLTTESECEGAAQQLGLSYRHTISNAGVTAGCLVSSTPYVSFCAPATSRAKH